MPTTTSSTSTAPKKEDELPDFFGRTPDATSLMTPINYAKVPGYDPILKANAFDVAGTGRRSGIDLSRFRMAMDASQPDINKYGEQEIAEINRLYSPLGYEAQLADIRRRRVSALDTLQSRIFGDMRRQLNLDAIGAPSSGLGSYMTERAAGTAARVRDQAIADMIAQERADAAALAEARGAAQGRRGLITDTALARMLGPAEQDLKFQGGYQDILNRALQAALQNTDLGYATPV